MSPASHEPAPTVADTDKHPLLLFDGVCNLCESSVQFVIRHDCRAQFRFAPLQSHFADELLGKFGTPARDLTSMMLVEGGHLYFKSRAALRVARRLDRPWPVVFYLFSWVPRAIADRVYDFIGNRRYRWFGRKSECWVPDPTLRERFVDADAAP